MQNIILKSCCLILFALAVLNAKGQRWDDYMDKMIQEYELGNYEEALENNTKALELAKNEFTINGDEIFNTEIYRAYFLTELNKKEEALDVFVKSISYRYKNELNFLNYENILIEANILAKSIKRYSEAIYFLKILLNHFENNESKNSNKYAATAEKIAEIFEQKSQIDSAIYFYELSYNNYLIDVFDEEQKANYYNNIGLYYYQLDSLSHAEVYFKNALSYIIDTENYSTKFLIIDNLLQVYNLTPNNNTEIFELLKIAENIIFYSHIENDTLYGEKLCNICETYLKLYKYNDALNCLEYALNRLSNDIILKAILLQNKALYYETIGDYEKAFNLYIEALDIQIEHLGVEHSNTLITKNNLALLYFHIGKISESIEILEENIVISKENFGENIENYIIDLINLGEIYRHSNDFEKYKKGRQLLHEGIEILKREGGQESYLYSLSLANLSLYSSDSYDYEQAIKFINEAKSINEKLYGKNHSSYILNNYNLAIYHAELNEYRVSIPLYKECLDYYEKNKIISNIYLMTLAHLANAYNQTNQLSEANITFKKFNTFSFKSIQRNFNFLTEYEKSNIIDKYFFYKSSFHQFCYENFTKVPETISEDFNLILASNGLLLSNNINIREAVNTQKDTSLINLFENYIVTSKQLDKAYEYTLEQRKINSIDIEQLEQKAESLERELVQRTSSFIVYPDYTLGKEDITKALSENEVAIQFNSFPYHNGKEWTDSTMYVAYILNNKGVLQYIPLFKETTIAPLLEVFSNKEKANEVNQNLTLLHKFIWQPLQAHLKDIETIYYAPSGLLHKVPFVALKDSSNNYVGEQYHLQAVLSTRDIPKLKEQTQQSNQNLIALMGGANFDKFTEETIDENSIDFLMNMPLGSVLRNIDRSGWLYLKGSLKEVENINKLAQIAGKTTLLKTGTDASEENFKQMVKEQMPGILHIATHGYYVPPPDEKTKSTLSTMDDNYFKSNDDPLLRSGILLSGANQKWVHKQNTDSENDGILTALEISRLNLSNTELVVLSACETGLGDIKGSEGVYGLQRAFKMAGAKRQIVSLWQVPDKETAEMMELFYTYLFKDKLSFSESFKKAQNAMKQNHPNEPLKWAGFVLVE